MGNIIISGGTIATPGTGVHTLAALINRVRSYLHDKVAPYLWGDDELTGCYSEVIRALCIEFPAIQDRTTTAICAAPYVAGDIFISVHQAIRNIERAKISGETTYLNLTTRAAMDENYPDWANAPRDTPRLLIVSGVGNDFVALYPPPVAAGTLEMIVTRGPLVDADYATDSAVVTALGVDDIFLAHGIVALALMVGDRDAEDIAKGETHLGLYKDGKENYKRGQLRKNFLPQGSKPHLGAGV